MIQYRFSSDKTDFLKILRQRVNEYFKEHKISRHANTIMVLKTVMAFAIFLVPFSMILLFGNELHLSLTYGFWLIMAFGKAFIGASVMHDSLHGSYSNKKWINQLIGWSSYLIGINPKMWQIQHNILHHTYTNVHEIDEDLDAHYVLRFSPNQDRRWFHKYQHIYVWFFYCLPFILWSSIKDFKKLMIYKAKGFIKPGLEFNKYLLIIVLQKLVYFSLFMGIPMYLLGWSFGMTLVMLLFMEAVTGLLLSFVLQTAHVMPGNRFINQPEPQINENWAEHQLMTTTNYGRKSKILCWFAGGLNFQIEHHLFPNVCHIHYPNIAEIVRKTTKEYKLPYFEFKTFGQAIHAHYHQLKLLGSGT